MKKKIIILLILIATFLLSLIINKDYYKDNTNKEPVIEKNDNVETLAFFVDGIPTDTIPTTSNYFTDVKCYDSSKNQINVDSYITWNGSAWKISIQNISDANAKCDVYFDLKDKPKGWNNPVSGSLMEAIKADNTVGSTWTIPGKQVHYAGYAARSSCSVGSSYNQYYWTYADSYEIDATTGKFNLTGVHTGVYSEIYQSLPGKYIVSTSYGNNSNSTNVAKTTTALTALYKVESATYNASGTSYVYYLTMANWVSVSSSQVDYYWTYGTGVKADTTNGTAASTKLELTGVNTLQYSSDYANLVGKYVVGTSVTGNAMLTNTQKTTNNLSNVYRIVATGETYFIYEKPPESVLAATPDDYGTSYYFRGVVNNNFIIFANMCWRIVRITGDGSIKLTLFNYNPNNAENPCSASEDGTTNAFARYSGTSYQSAFKTSPYNDNTYVGFMYGTANATTYEDAIANTGDSTILTNLKTWYDAKFVSEGYTHLFADVIWCNDKSLATSTYNPDSWTDTTINTGIAKIKTNYKAKERNYPVADANPSLICPDASTSNTAYKNASKFTAADTVNGNGALNGYKIGLLTIDEISFAGGKAGTSNITNYLYKNATSIWRLMSPYHMNGTNAFEWTVGSNFSPSGTNNIYTTSYGVRPAIALRYDYHITHGNGTQENPYDTDLGETA